MGGKRNMYGKNQKFILSFSLKAEIKDSLNVGIRYI